MSTRTKREKKPTHTLTILKADGTREVRDVVPDLRTLQGAVGGLIEPIGFFKTFEGRRCQAYCNEEGWLHSLPLNMRASRLWLEQYPAAQALVGDVAIVVKKKKEEEVGKTRRPTCGHSACSQHYIDTGSAECVEKGA